MGMQHGLCDVCIDIHLWSGVRKGDEHLSVSDVTSCGFLGFVDYSVGVLCIWTH